MKSKRLETIKELLAVGTQISEQVAALQSDDAKERELLGTRAAIDEKIVELLVEGQKEEADARQDVLDTLTALRTQIEVLAAAVSKMNPVINVTVPERSVTVQGAKVEIPLNIPTPQVTIQHSEPVPTRTRRTVTRLSPMGDPLESMEEHEYESEPKKN